ncbi:MAG TPA: hypothetical protein VN040_19540 [Pseudosphingobacterium sp.]|nr:hypothetical protein [Pseudosphingobacterium sp.]
MLATILHRIHALGGSTDQVTGVSLQSDLEAIVLKCPLYPKPEDTPWNSSSETEPIYGLEEYLVTHRQLLETDRAAFYRQLLDDYFEQITEDEPLAQSYLTARLFTPFKAGSADFEEWNDIIDETAVKEVVKADRPDFMQLAWSYSYPDSYYISLSDKNPENPKVFGTDHEAFFREIDEYGTMEDFLHSFFTKEELIIAIEKALEKNKEKK